MIKNIITAFVALGISIGVASAANVVTVGGASGNVGSRVEVAVGLDFDSQDITAAEIHIPLPDMVTPVAGSCTKNEARLPDHQVSADMRNGEYVIVIYSIGLKRIAAGTGEAVRFALDLGENPGEFSLEPTVKLSDADGKIIPATGEGGTLEVLGSRLELSATDIDFGRVPIRGTYTRTVTASNSGTAPLAFDGFTTDIPGLDISAAEAVVAPGASTPLTLTYKPTERAQQVTGRFTVQSNSTGRAPYVRISSVPFSVNELHTGSASGISDEEVTVAVTMNNMEPIAGAEVTYTLPEALEYVDGSVQCSGRAANLTATATVSAQRKLRIILFGFDNKAVSGDDGELFTFGLRLNGQSGTYTLEPENVILANVEGENMTSDTSAGTVMVESPRIYGDSRMDVGNVPLSGSDTFEYTVWNYGSAPLRIDRVAFLNEVAVCPAEMPVVVGSYMSTVIPVKIVKPAFGDFSTTMNIYCNDPTARLKSVDVTGTFYSVNEMSFEGVLSKDGKSCIVEGSLRNEEAITALQLDLLPPAGATINEQTLTLCQRAASHNFTIAKVGDNRYRLIIFSLGNAPFTGAEGGIFTFAIEGENLDGSELRVENMKVSGTDGVDYTSPDAGMCVVGIRSIKVESVEIKGEADTIKKGRSLQLTAEVLPANATNRDVVWTSSDTQVATVDSEGCVTALAAGNVTITAEAADGSGSTDSYELTVKPVVKGDSNDNDEVTVTDAVHTANYAAGKEVEIFSHEAADVDEDGSVTHDDALATVSIALEQDVMPVTIRDHAVSCDEGNETDKLVVADYSAKIGETVPVPVTLENTRDYVALQADVNVPEGMSLVDVRAGERAESSHLLMTRRVDDRTMRVALFDTGNAAFAGQDGAVFEVVVKAEAPQTDNIKIGNIRASDAAAQEYVLTSTGGNNSDRAGVAEVGYEGVRIEAGAGAINVYNAEGCDVAVYATDGTMIANVRAQSGVESLKMAAGMYIVATGKQVEKVIVR